MKDKLKCFRSEHVVIILIVKMTEGYVFVFDFREMAASFSSTLGSALDCIFHWCACLLIHFKSELRALWEFLGSIIFEKSEVSSIWHIDITPSTNLFIYIKNKSWPNTDICGRPEFIFSQSEVWPFKTTLCFRSLR